MPNPGSLRTVGTRVHVFFRSRPGGGQLQDTGKARSARKAWEAAYDTHCGKYASERPAEMVQDMLWAFVGLVSSEDLHIETHRASW